MSMKIGIISDTHGLVRPEAKKALAGCAAILHAGDIGDESVLVELATIAPVHAVRGNIDSGAWARKYPASELIALDGRHFYLMHDLNELDLDPVAAGVDVVITGHSHRPPIALASSCATVCCIATRAALGHDVFRCLLAWRTSILPMAKCAPSVWSLKLAEVVSTAC